MADDSDTGLPASIAAAWGLRSRPPKGPKRSLSLGQIVEAAIRVAGSDGLTAVSMSRVAAEIGTAPMSLYRYVSAKEELLVLMVDAAFGTPPAAPDTGADWRAGLTRWAWAERDALRRHPWILRVPINAPPATPNQLAWLEAGLRCLADTGLSEQQKLSVMLLLTGFVRSEVGLATEIETAAQASGTTVTEVMAGYAHLLQRLVDDRRFPALSTVVQAGVMQSDAEGDDFHDEFVFGLDRILDGVEALVRARTATTENRP